MSETNLEIRTVFNYFYFFSARPQYNVQAFALLTTYPSQELKDDDVTLKDASLVGGTIMQRLK